jgi:hypothetical protein
MARVLHLLVNLEAPLAATVIRGDVAAGDEVAVAFLAEGAVGPPLPEAVSVHRVPAEWSYERLLEQIFAADRVVTW